MVVDHENEIFEDGLVVGDVDFDDDVTFAEAVFRGGDVRFTSPDRIRRLVCLEAVLGGYGNGSARVRFRT